MRMCVACVARVYLCDIPGSSCQGKARHRACRLDTQPERRDRRSIDQPQCVLKADKASRRLRSEAFWGPCGRHVDGDLATCPPGRGGWFFFVFSAARVLPVPRYGFGCPSAPLALRRTCERAQCTNLWRYRRGATAERCRPPAVTPRRRRHTTVAVRQEKKHTLRAGAAPQRAAPPHSPRSPSHPSGGHGAVRAIVATQQETHPPSGSSTTTCRCPSVPSPPSALDAGRVPVPTQAQGQSTNAGDVQRNGRQTAYSHDKHQEG